VFRVRPTGKGLERLTNHLGFDDQGAPSPNRRQLAIVSSRSGQSDIWILEVATGALRNLMNDRGGDFRPSWSPDGQWIAFSSDRNSKQPKLGFTVLHSTELYVVRVEGSGLRRITNRDAVAGSPSWSSDAKRLVYYEAAPDDLRRIRSGIRQRGTTQLVSIDLDSGERRVLTTGAGEKWSPRWIGEDADER